MSLGPTLSSSVFCESPGSWAVTGESHAHTLQPILPGRLQGPPFPQFLRNGICWKSEELALGRDHRPRGVVELLGWEWVGGRGAWSYTLVLRWASRTRLHLRYVPRSLNQGHVKIFSCHSWGWGRTGVLASEAEGITKHPTRHKAVPTT